MSADRWWILTGRDREGQRTGLGHESLREALDHLRRRGDRTVQVCTSVETGWATVHLTDPTTIARLTAE